jgi:hypothetical protein
MVVFSFKEVEFSEWSDCIGIPCQMGKQQRIRTCSKQSLCKNEEIQEQNCFVPCLNKNLSISTSARTLSKSDGIYSNWTNWSECQLPDCTSIRTRHCLKEPCLDNLSETHSCKGTFCPSKRFFFLNYIMFILFVCRY